MAKLIGFDQVVKRPAAMERLSKIEDALLVLIEAQRILEEILWCNDNSDYGNLIDVDPTKSSAERTPTSPKLAAAIQSARAILKAAS